MDRVALAWKVGDRTVRRFAADQGLSWSGAVGLYLFLSIPPLMILVTWLGDLFAPRDEATTFAVDQIAKLVPGSTDLLHGIVDSAPEGTTSAIVSVVILLLSGSRVFAALTSAINVMWRRVDAIDFWRRQMLRAGMLIIAGVLVATSAATEWLIGTVSELLSINGFAAWLADWQLLPAVILAAALWATYMYLPQERVDRRVALLAAVLATVLIRIAQWLIGLAIAGAIDPSRAYGTLGEVALLLTWALVIGAIVLLGAELVVVIEELRGRDIDDARERSEQRFTRDEDAA
jgi:membrane protein